MAQVVRGSGVRAATFPLWLGGEIPLLYLAPGFAANRGAAARAAGQARQVLGDERFTQAWEQGQGLILDDAVAMPPARAAAANAPPRAGPA